MKNFTYPHKSGILIFSAFMIFLPVFILGPFGYQIINSGNRVLLKLIILVPSLLATLGFIYCTLGYHFQIMKGDELKFRIHLEALNIAFTTSLIFLFALIFVFLNLNPALLNYLIIILALIAIVAYVFGIEAVKGKYR
ncbi:MAG: hypothetical protein WAU11_08510 [Ignavibacteriaceae bacterium]